MVEYMLTTIDNPFNPHTHFNEWYAYDRKLGHKTPELLAKVAMTSDDLPPSLQRDAINEAIDYIVKENVSGVHRKISNTNPSNSP